MKNCPYCAEPIQDSAIKCRYCGSSLQGGALSREWYRSRRGKKIAGICAGLAEEFGISTTPIRLAFVLLTLIGGPGIILYIILWVVMPYRAEPRVQIAHEGDALELPRSGTTRFLDRF
jgi:phage shock protein PspC (stress-responsive transcriptional regulator)